jgi:hypothetical protein
VESTDDLTLVIETARDLVAQLMGLSKSLDDHLQRVGDLDAVISILHEKKARVETLNEVTRQIRAHLKVDETGNTDIPVPEHVKLKFAGLMMDFRALIEEESRIEKLITGRGIRISGRSGRR